MVHIPFLNIEVPELRVAQVLPDLVTLVIRLCTRALDKAQHLTHPLPRPIEELYVREVVESFPWEIQLVFQRGCAGKHRDEDQLSEELEDASLDYYRRMIRTAAVGESEEDQEDVTARKLGLDQPSAQEAAWDRYLREHVDELLVEPEDAMAVEGTAGERDAIEDTLMAAQEQRLHAYQQAAEHEQRRGALSGKVRTDSGQAAGAALRAGLGLALAVGAVKGLGLLVRRLRALRKPSKKAKKTGKPAPAARAATTAPSAPAAPAAGATAATAAAMPQQAASSSGRQQPQQASAAQQPQDKGAASARASRTTRKR